MYKDKNLKFAIYDGIFYALMLGLTNDFFIPFILLLGASPSHVSFLSALPNLTGALVQIKGAEVTAFFKDRKSSVLFFVSAQIGFLFLMSFLAAARIGNIYFFIVAVVLSTSSIAIASSAWGSMMSDIIPQYKRGEYMGRRNMIIGIVAIAVSVIAGYILKTSSRDDLYKCFSVFFLLAGLFRIGSCVFIGKMTEPKHVSSTGDYFSLWDFVRRMKRSNFAKFSFFVALMSFSVNIASPFFSVFMLRDLKFDYLTYIILTVTATLAIYMSMSRWGRIADSVGNIRVIRFCAPLIAVLPVLWIFSQHPVYIFFVQVFAGVLWGGFNLCTTNFIFDAVTPQKRIRCICYFNLFNGTALACGVVLGGFIYDKLPSFMHYQLFSIFVFSSILRLVVGALAFRHISEVRPTEKIKSLDMFYGVMGIKPIIEVERKPLRY